MGLPSKTNRTPGSDGTVRTVMVIGHGCTDPRAGLVTAAGRAIPALADGPAKAGGAATAPPSVTAAIAPSTGVSLVFTRPPPWRADQRARAAADAPNGPTTTRRRPAAGR